MWNSQEPLELLMSMPTVLTIDNLAKLQDLIDVNKILNSQTERMDLCGQYAPFCEVCNKSLKYPCAHAYIKMKQNEGLEVEIDKDAYIEIQPEPEPVVEFEPEKEKHYIRIAIAKKVR